MTVRPPGISATKGHPPDRLCIGEERIIGPRPKRDELFHPSPDEGPHSLGSRKPGDRVILAVLGPQLATVMVDDTRIDVDVPEPQRDKGAFAQGDDVGQTENRPVPPRKQIVTGQEPGCLQRDIQRQIILLAAGGDRLVQRLGKREVARDRGPHRGSVTPGSANASGWPRLRALGL